MSTVIAWDAREKAQSCTFERSFNASFPFIEPFIASQFPVYHAWDDDKEHRKRRRSCYRYLKAASNQLYDILCTYSYVNRWRFSAWIHTCVCVIELARVRCSFSLKRPLLYLAFSWNILQTTLRWNSPSHSSCNESIERACPIVSNARFLKSFKLPEYSILCFDLTDILLDYRCEMETPSQWDNSRLSINYFRMLWN